MNREIKFRGKRLGSGDWVYGDLHTTHGIDENGTAYTRYEIRGFKPNFGPVYFTVDGNTVGQYTGLKDRNGKEIYEGDIFSFYDEDAAPTLQGRFEVKWDNDYVRFGYRDLDTPTKLSWIAPFERRWQASLEVIGNIHDNPELMKG